jgi:hypothetical protein
MSNYDDLFNNTPAAEVQQTAPQLSKEEYAAMKKEQREGLFTLSDNTAMAVAGDSGKFKQYLDVQSKFDRYSAVNTLLIMAQKPEATRIADFDTWKAKGGSVKKDQTGIGILEPHEYTKEDGSPGIGYNIKKVFDISQIDTQRMKAGSPPPKPTDRQILAALTSASPLKIIGVDTLPDDRCAETNPDTGEINVRKGMEFADIFRSIVQELGYYKADADVNKVPANPSFVGYCTAYILCKKHGIDTQSFDFSAAPDVFWQSDAKGVKQELTIIRDVAESISARMAKQLTPADKQPRNTDAR